MKPKTVERIPPEVFADADLDFKKNIVTARDGRVWIDVTVEAKKIDRMLDGERNVGLEAWGIRLEN